MRDSLFNAKNISFMSQNQGGNRRERLYGKKHRPRTLLAII